MSHVVSIKTTLDDLDVIDATCKQLGLTLVRGQQTYKWWGHSAGDHPVPAGFTASDLGKCEHAIQVPGTDWEVGVVKARNPDGTPKAGYTLLFDYYDVGNWHAKGLGGAAIAKALGGTDAAGFLKEYSVQKNLKVFRAHGYTDIKREEKGGSTILRINVGGTAVAHGASGSSPWDRKI